MNAFRPKVLALMAAAATLSLTACATSSSSASSAGSASSPSSPATSPAAPSQSASAATSAPAAVPSASTVQVTGQLGSFQVPAGAKVADNVVLPGQVILIFSGIAPAKVLAFYTAELPQAGYHITSSELVGEAGGTAAIVFNGHGFTGTIASVTNFTAASGTQAANIPGLGHKNVTSVELTQG